jgi:hypothetical protein
LETETLTPNLDDVPGKHLMFMEESEIQLDANTSLAPNFTRTEYPTEKDVPKRLKETEPDAGELNSADDTYGTV